MLLVSIYGIASFIIGILFGSFITRMDMKTEKKINKEVEQALSGEKGEQK